MRPATGAAEKKAVEVKFAADAVTNRVFVVEMELGAGAGGFFADPRKVRPIAVVGSRQVAATKMSSAGPVEGGEVLLEPGKSVTAVLMLTDDTIQKLRIQVLDADTDAVLYESPKDVPVRVMT